MCLHSLLLKRITFPGKISLECSEIAKYITMVLVATTNYTIKVSTVVENTRQIHWVSCHIKSMKSSQRVYGYKSKSSRSKGSVLEKSKVSSN